MVVSAKQKNEIEAHRLVSSHKQLIFLFRITQIERSHIVDILRHKIKKNIKY